MPICPSCHREIAAPGKFCPECGALWPAAPAAAAAEGATIASPDSRDARDARDPSSSSSRSSSSLHGRFEPGTRLGARYRVVGLLGRGGMGEVYRADDLELNQSVALKFLPERVARNAGDLARLRQEVRTARQIAHPNVCRTYDIAEADGQIFVVMEYVDGEDLASVLRRLGRPTPDKALEIARAICLGLGAAHENGVLHRDLKPANIMIDGRGRVRITDFGLAGTVEEIAADVGIAGTPAYMAPEQLRSGAASIQSDIFALGLVLFEIFTGKRAVDATPAPDPTRRGSDSSVRTPSSLVGDVDPAVERVILRCLERDPARRPQSAYAVFGALPGGDPLAAAVAAGETPSPELVANAGVEGSVRPLYAGLAAVVAVLSVLGIAWIKTPLFKGLDKPPGTLAVRADEILNRLTGSPAPRYTADGFRHAPAVKDTLSHADSLAAIAAGKKPRVKAEPMRAKQYWRRWSPSEFRTENLHRPSPTVSDPPQAYPGSATLALDMAGRLIAFEAIPAAGADTLRGRGPDWAEILAAAGRDANRVRPIAPPAAFVAYADTVAAWRLSDSTAAETTLVAASVGGHATRVETYAGKNVLGHLGVEVDPFKPGPMEWVNLIFFVVVPIVGSVILARHNLRSKRGDVRGAMVVGISIVVFYLIEHLFAFHVGEVGLWSVLLAFTGSFPLGHALLHGVTMAIAYLAIEPYVRRLWPGVLVSWARLVAGRVRDPIIGRDVLVGSAFGALSTLFLLLRAMLERKMGLLPGAPVLSEEVMGAMVGAPQIVSTVSYSMAIAFLQATQFYTMLVIFRFIVRSTRFAVLLAVLFFAATQLDYASKAIGIEAVGVLIVTVGAIFIALRFGYVATLAAVFVGGLCEVLAWSLDFSSWIAPQTLISWGILLAILAYGFLAAVGGKSLFSDPLKDPVATVPRPR